MPKLVSGPAGAGKSQEAKRLLDAATGPMVAADFQSILAALLLLERLPNGRYPQRNPAQAAWLLPLTEAIRQTVITFAGERGIDVVATNSDGSPQRRAHLLQRLGPGATERVIDPGLDIVTRRLSGPDGRVTDQCGEAHQTLVFEGVMENLVIPIEFRADESRESPGMLAGVLMTYGTRANDRPEMFEQDAFHWPESGILIREQHNRQAPIVRAMPYLEGRELRINAPLLNNTRGRDVAEAMKGPNPVFTGPFGGV